MKKTLIYSLVGLMFIAVNFRAICYFAHLAGHTIVLSPNFLSEEEKSESDESQEADFENVDFEYLRPDNLNLHINLPVLSFGKGLGQNIDTSNYSAAIYSPPDPAII